MIEDLITAAPMNRFHVAHPEVVGIGSHRVNGLFEADFDFEPPSVETDKPDVTISRWRRLIPGFLRAR